MSLKPEFHSMLDVVVSCSGKIAVRRKKKSANYFLRMLKIIADCKIPFLKGVLEPYSQIKYLSGALISRKDVKSADALIVRTRTLCNAELLDGTGVKFIATATIGHDHIDKDYCTQNGIGWANAPGCNADSVVQYMASALAMILRHTGKSFKEITIGIVGAGNVGHRFAKLCLSLIHI